MSTPAHPIAAGDRFGRLTACERIGTKNNNALWSLICECGANVHVMAGNLRSGRTRSCGCLAREFGRQKADDLSGQRFHFLVAIAPTERRNASRDVIWRCVCDCGEYKDVSAAYLKSGHTKSCGNHRSELSGSATHRMTDSTEYRIWLGIIQRCTNPNVTAWPNYGGRGIFVCDRWRYSFTAFYDDMGARPSKRHTVDRIDNDGGYEPSNCRWATWEQQAQNRRGANGYRATPHSKHA